MCTRRSGKPTSRTGPTLSCSSRPRLARTGPRYPSAPGSHSRLYRLWRPAEVIGRRPATPAVFQARTEGVHRSTPSHEQRDVPDPQGPARSATAIQVALGLCAGRPRLVWQDSVVSGRDWRRWIEAASHADCCRWIPGHKDRPGRAALSGTYRQQFRQPAYDAGRTVCCRPDREGKPDTSRPSRPGERPVGPRSLCRRSRLPLYATQRLVPRSPS